MKLYPLAALAALLIATSVQAQTTTGCPQCTVPAPGYPGGGPLPGAPTGPGAPPCGPGSPTGACR